jgi:hypothetical protein
MKGIGVVIGIGVIGGIGVLVYFAKKASAKEYLTGDVNGDGVVNEQDIAELERFIMGHTTNLAGDPWPADWIVRMDVNKNGSIDMGDVVAITRIIDGQ